MTTYYWKKTAKKLRKKLRKKGHRANPAYNERAQMSLHRDRFRTQKKSAQWRGKKWQLTFEEWLSIWINSGHYHERGNGPGQYCMGRVDENGQHDIGPYAVGNVRIITVTENNDACTLIHRQARERAANDGPS